MRRCITLAVLLCLLSLAAAHDSQTAFASFLMDQRLPTATPPPKGTPPPPARSSLTDTPEAEDDTPEAEDDTPEAEDTPTPTATPKPPELQPTSTATPLTELTKPTEIPGAAAYAVNLLGAWVTAGAPATQTFPYTGYDGATYAAVFAEDIQPLFTVENLWFAGAPACTSCHHENLENARHEMDLSSYAGILAGADRLSAPPGAPILGQSQSGAMDFNWETSVLQGRLRNNRMPPGMPFDISEANRDGPVIEVDGTAVLAVELVGAWVAAGGAPETAPFGDYKATFATNILPLFTEPGMWYADAPACSSCHHGNLENAYHEMDLSSYAGILAGADRLSAPPGVPILAHSQSDATGFDWEVSTLRNRLRNNRMPPGMPFDVSEANRDGPLIEVAGTPVLAVELIGDWVAAGAPERAPFGDYKATFAANLLPLFTEPGMWYADAPACSSCHHANLENAYHEMDLSSYAGILAGADRLSTPLLGQPTHGSTAFDWEVSTLRNRLRNNRMPPGMPFDISEANRNGPLVQVGYVEGQERGASIAGITIDLTTPPDKAAVDRLVNRGGCKACHTIAGLDDAVGTLGPPWCKLTQEISAGENDLAFAYRSIVSPNAVVTEGYPANLMPGNFGELFSKEELQTLVAFIATLDCD